MGGFLALVILGIAGCIGMAAAGGQPRSRRASSIEPAPRPQGFDWGALAFLGLIALICILPVLK